MNFLKKVLVVIILSFFLSNIFGEPSQCSKIAASKHLNEKITQLVNAERLKYSLPALSVSISLPIEQSTRNYVSGYLTRDDNKEINSNTIFQVGSITKTFTAVLILKLAEENKLVLNEKISHWLPEYPKWQNITVTNLLTHTSGAYDVIDTPNFWQTLKADPQRHWSLQDLANLAYAQPNYFPPGMSYKYTNTDYILLGLIIERVTHQPLTQAYNEYLLNPNKYDLIDTYYTANGYPHKILNNLAHGYDDEGTFGYNVDVTNLSTSFGSSASAIVSTPKDLIYWLKQLNSGKIISNESLQLMHTLYSEQNGQLLNLKQFLQTNNLNNNPWMDVGEGMGMGLVYFRNYGFVWAHAGGTPGYQSFYAYNPCKNIYVVLMYNVQPKQSFVFLQIAAEIFKTLNQSALVKKEVIKYQKTGSIPFYCTYQQGK